MKTCGELSQSIDESYDGRAEDIYLDGLQASPVIENRNLERSRAWSSSDWPSSLIVYCNRSISSNCIP